MSALLRHQAKGMTKIGLFWKNAKVRKDLGVTA